VGEEEAEVEEDDEDEKEVGRRMRRGGCIGDGGGPARSSSIRTRATVAEVTGGRITAVSPTSTNRNTTTVCLESNQTTPTPADCIACTTSNGDIEVRS
jgi:hypothetical protein